MTLHFLKNEQRLGSININPDGMRKNEGRVLDEADIQLYSGGERVRSLEADKDEIGEFWYPCISEHG